MQEIANFERDMDRDVRDSVISYDMSLSSNEITESNETLPPLPLPPPFQIEIVEPYDPPPPFEEHAQQNELNAADNNDNDDDEEHEEVSEA